MDLADIDDEEIDKAWLSSLKYLYIIIIITHAVPFCNEDDKILSVSALQLLLSEEEVKIKSQLWFAENADYLKQQESAWQCLNPEYLISPRS